MPNTLNNLEDRNDTKSENPSSGIENQPSTPENGSLNKPEQSENFDKNDGN